MLDLGIQPARTPSVSIFADESKPDKNCPWLITGILILPNESREAALAALRASRDRFEYNKEIHFVELRNHPMSPHGAKTKVAVDWVRQVVHDKKKIWNLHIVAVKQALLDRRRFGSEAEDNVYARFFRSALRYGLKSAARGKIVSRIFHDDSHLEQHEYFSWNAIHRLGKMDGLQFACDKIEFISSNHQKLGHPEPWAAEFIQLVDVWMGCFRQIVTTPNPHKGKADVVKHACGLFRILNDPKHKCRPLRGSLCTYDHSGRCSVGFFPDDRVRPSDFPDVTGPEALNFFYRGERLAYFDDIQQSLF